MKKVYFSVLLALISFASFAQEVIITGYVDSPCSGAAGRVLEIYVNGSVDFTGWTIGRQSNGDMDGYDTNLDISELGSITDDFAYITNDEAIFEAEFGTMSNVIVNSGINSNGNDAFQIVDNNSTVIERFGEEFTNGTDTPWEHTNSYYLRNNGSTANGGNFDVSNWTFGALEELEDQGTCNNGTQLNQLVSLGSFTPSNTSEPDPLGLGQMAFTAFNADGDDDFAMVTFTDIPANTSIYFSDKEWTGAELNSGEASYEWNTGNEIIPAGTVIAFNTISETPSVTYGSIIGEPGGLSGGSEAIFAFLGTDVENPTNLSST